MKYIYLTAFILNVLLLIIMVFIEKKRTDKVMAWMIIMTIFPIGGFFIYLFIGGRLDFVTAKTLNKKKLFDKELLKNKILSSTDLNINLLSESQKDYADLILLNANVSQSFLTMDNDVTIFDNGADFFDSMLNDFKMAQQTINILFYIISNDEIGNRVFDILKEKAKQGVKVRVLYDAIGSWRLPKKFLKELKNSNIQILAFFPSLLGTKTINMKFNYRNHRKIVVIDGEIGYVGGFNVRDDHLGKNKKLSPWRDTGARISGSAVYELQYQFLSDWCFTNAENNHKNYMTSQFFNNNFHKKGDVPVQIVSSGPDSSVLNIKQTMLKMISKAKKEIIIETPYFISDNEFTSALKLAINSGVFVSLIIPKLPDRKSVHYATMSYVGDMLDIGVKVFAYNGFIHSKLLIADEVFTIGSCNVDQRSFTLNFETNAVFYDTKLAKIVTETINNDLKNSFEITKELYKKRNLLNKISSSVFRLFSSLM